MFVLDGLSGRLYHFAPAAPAVRNGTASSANSSGVSIAMKWPELASTYFAPGICAATLPAIAGVRIGSCVQPTTRVAAAIRAKIGRASCRERVEIVVGEGS